MGTGIPRSRGHRHRVVMGTVTATTVVALALVAGGAGTSTADDRQGARCAVPVVPVAQAVRSMDASELSKAARLARTSVHRFTSTIAGDPSAWLDDCGQTVIVDPVRPVPRAPRSWEQIPEDFGAAPASLAQTFALHSKPGSKKTLFLDFRTQWLDPDGLPAPEAAPGARRYEGWSLDDQPDAFNDDERLIIQMIWLRVVEDFSTWDIDVTTELPVEAALTRDGPTDDVFGQRAIFVVDKATVDECDCAGYALLGSFDWLGPKSPAFVVDDTRVPSDAMYNNWRSVKSWALAETASHEIGHTLSLMHDGVTVPWGTFEYDSGRRPWGPIMGDSDWGLGQWSNGDYLGSTNTEDDLAIIGRYLRAEPDEDDGPGSARTLVPASPLSGLVNSARDVDHFRFTHPGGPLTIEARPLHWGANVDIEMTIRRTGAQPDVWVVDPVAKQADYTTSVSGLSAVWTAAKAPAGDYQISIRGVGAETEGPQGKEPYSAYGSVGAYTIAARLAESAFTLASAEVVAQPPGVSIRRFTPVGGRPPFHWMIVSQSADLLLEVDLIGRYTFRPPGLGEWKATVAVRDVDGRLAQADVAVFGYSPMEIAAPVALVATVRKKFTHALVATHAHRTVTWKSGKGALPPGLRLAADGRISGVPTRTGTWRLSVQATDAAGRQADVTVSITVRKAA